MKNAFFDKRAYIKLDEDEKKMMQQATQKLVFETNEKPPMFCYFRKLEDQVLSRNVVWFYGEKVEYQLKDKISLLGCNKIVRIKFRFLQK